MFGWGDAEENHKEFYNGEELEHHEAKFSHELIAGAASYEAMKAYNKHREENGAPGSHSKAKEIIAGLVGAEIDRLAETKGRDAWDKHQLKKQAEENAKGLYDDKYGNEPEEE
ncbi:hypothetical protein AAP_01724 [Ascosphaera apis ARSEF 7405]|uniref:CipC-like antibiotic response protein n=1 Tax=Ascosphaera apis ARSEF 7405 TaxID=392613 RepID=A0A168BFG2_9EURO|nr:hypothetical protein AAP_01724 [Ascosphaera apis ARSEF 7405]